VKKTFIMILTICAIATAQDLPRIAVYVTSTMLPHENRVLERSVMSTLLNSGRYKVVDRSAESSSTLEAEHIKQRDGSVNSEQIKKLGAQLGVDFICIPDITKAFGKWSFSVRIIDVETAEVVSMGEESFIEMYMDKLKLALDKVLGEMLKTQTAAARSPEAAAAAAPGQIQVKPKYDGTEIYASEHFAAYGGPIAIVGPNNIFTVIYEGKNYYKIRNAKGNDGFVLKKDVVGAGTQFVDTRNKPAVQETTAPVAVDTKTEPAEQATADAGKTMNDWGTGTVNIPTYQQTDYVDFTGGQRVGTWFLNWLIPGLGSFAIMHDGVGGVTQLALGGGGMVLMYSGASDNNGGLVLVGFLSALSGGVYNIVRSITYKKKMPTNMASLENSGLNFAVLPDKNGDLKGYMVYSMEF